MDYRTIPIVLKLASDGGFQLTDEEKIRVARQLRETRRPAHIPIIEAEVSPGADDRFRCLKLPA